MSKHHLVKLTPDIYSRLALLASTERRSVTSQLQHLLDLELPALPVPANKPAKPASPPQMPANLGLRDKLAWLKENPLAPGQEPEDPSAPMRLRREP